MKKKIIGTLSAALVAIMVLGFPVHAATHTYTSSGQNFSAPWELAYENPNVWKIVYGYNVFLIHEDYTHGVSFSKHHVATVTNANGAFSKDNEPGQWAKIEVTHSGSYVTYSISY